MKFENRVNSWYMYTIIVLMIIISSYFTRKFITIPNADLISPIFIILLAIPSFYYFVSYLGFTRGLIGLIILGCYALLVESIGILTGFPYGEFSYSQDLGMKIGFVPWPVFFAWTPLVLGSYTLAQRWFSSNSSIIAFATGFLVLTDLVLDPGAVYLGFWSWTEPGIYYGVPIINFIGWIITGFGGMVILHYILLANTDKNLPIKTTSSLVLSIIFWTSLAFFSPMLIPFIFGLFFILVIIGKERNIPAYFKNIQNQNSF